MSDELNKRLYEKFSSVLYAGSGNNANRAPVCFFSPGKPVDEALFAWGKQGFVENDLNNAFQFATFVNQIPQFNTRVAGGYEWESNGTLLWDVYEQILSPGMVVLPKVPANQKVQDELERLRSKLVVTTKRKNLITDEEEERIEDSPLVNAYSEYKTLRDNAVLAYHALYQTYLANPTDKVVASDWARTGLILQSNVDMAEKTWISKGYKNDYEKLMALIDQYSDATPAVAWQKYRLTLSKAKLQSPVSGVNFYPTFFFPNNFAALHWSKFSWSVSETNTSNTSTHRSTEWGGRGGFYMFSAGASGNSQRTTEVRTLDYTASKVEFEVTAIQIHRPWFVAHVLNSKKWSWNANASGNNFVGDELSNGEVPAKGLCPGYATEFVLVRNVRLTMEHNVEDVRKAYEESRVSGRAGLSFGPFSIGGNYSSFSSSRNDSSHVRFEKNAIVIPGMQIVAMKCIMLPKLPAADFDVTQSELFA